MSWCGCDRIPGWKIADRLGVVILLRSDFEAKTARRSRIYSNSWRFSGGSSVIRLW